MIFHPFPIAGAWIIDIEPRADDRGFFARTWCAEEFAARSLCTSFVQESVSFNPVAGTLRGLHYQVSPHPEAKLVRCTSGAIYDVVIDMREGSPTYLKWCAETLTRANRRALYIPEHCAHGFISLEDETEVLYLISEFHHPECARGVRWNDPALEIQWPREPRVMSSRDAEYELLSVSGRP